ncbi:MAG: hypothetical protein KJ793_05280 [Candidatus Omnitrophica bacterium]|nr:hypothetical protein [Candidatus Omnitrophota bacterium]
MRVEKEKRKVNIICVDGSSLSGVIHINPGQRVIDFIDDERKSFIAVTDLKFCDIKEAKSFQLSKTSSDKKKMVILNKNSVKLIEEI